MTKVRIDREGNIHRAILHYLAVRLQGCLAVHVPNSLDMGGDPRSKAIAQARAKSLGMMPGFPDLAVFWRGKLLLIEVKAPSGRLSDAQKSCHAALAAQGFPVAVARSVDEAATAIDEWLAHPSNVAVAFRGVVK